MNELIQEDIWFWETGKGGFLTKDFHSSEFEDKMSQTQMIAIDIVENLQYIRDRLGFAIKIFCGYICPAKQEFLRANNKTTVKGVSQHQWGRAVKVSTKNLTDVQRDKLLKELSLQFNTMGIARNFIYVDLNKSPRIWRY